MGDWDATCAVSRTAIGGGDPVMAIWSNVEWIRDTRGLLSEVWSHHRRVKDSEPSRRRWAALADKFRAAGIEDEADEIAAELVPPPIRVHWSWGEYDTYGGIGGDSDSPPLCLVHRSVAERLIEIGGYPDDELTDDPLARFLGACSAARIQLAGHEGAGGVQYGDFAEMRFVSRVGRVVRRWQRRLYWSELLKSIRRAIDGLYWRWRARAPERRPLGRGGEPRPSR